MTARLLVVHHTASPTLHTILEAVLDGARTPEVEGVEVVVRPALTCGAADVLDADGYVLGTPANLGYMSGALKHFFDTIYYPCLDATRSRPFGCYVHGNDDTAGALRGIEKIVTGLGWKRVADDLSLTGPPAKDDLERCWNLGATVAAAALERSK
jgi:multimeric flavodoxin WrbA